MHDNSLLSLKTQGYTLLPYPRDVFEAVTAAAAEWEHFCTLPIAEKERFPYVQTSNADTSGYKLKRGERGSTHDTKETMHVLRRNGGALMDQAGGGPGRPFIDTATRLIDRMAYTVRNIADRIEKTFSIRGLRDEVGAGFDDWIFRYLHYFAGQEAGGALAQRHADTSGMTIYLKPGPGLQCLSLDRQWQDIVVPPGEMLVTPNLQLQYRSEGKLKGTCHQVLADERTSAAGRYSMVCFIPFVRTPLFDTQRKGRQQDLPEGFNYDLSHEEFAGYFEQEPISEPIEV